MSEVLNKVIVLALNSAWQPINHYTVKKAIKSMTSGLDGQPPLKALDLDYELDENGEPNTDKLIQSHPTLWEDWVQLPVRAWDEFIQTNNRDFGENTGRIRVPTVVVACNYSGMPQYTPRANARTIRLRDGGICQYSGEFVGNKGNLDHVIPRDKGGKDTFDNLVWCKQKINSDKGNRYNHEAGLKLLRKPIAMPSLPRSVVMKDVKHPSWKNFLIL
jgi:5-methylcytosine-specific restriction endonuclease McrA